MFPIKKTENENRFTKRVFKNKITLTKNEKRKCYQIHPKLITTSYYYVRVCLITLSFSVFCFFNQKSAILFLKTRVVNLFSFSVFFFN